MKENFDDILKRKWAEQHFAVDEQHREQMESLLDKRKRRGIFPLWWLGAILLIGAVSAYIFLLAPSTRDAGLSKPDLSTIDAAESERIRSNGLYQSDQTIKSEDYQTSKHEQYTTTNSVVAKEKSPTENAPDEAAASLPIHRSLAVKEKVEPNAKSTLVSQKGKRKDQTVAVKTPDQTSVTIDRSSEINLSKDGQTTITLEEQSLVDSALLDQRTSNFPTIPTPEIRKAYNLLPIAGLEMHKLDYTSEQSPEATKAIIKVRRSLFLFGETGAGLVLPSQTDFDTGLKLRAGGGLGYKMSSSLQLSLSLGYLLQAGGFDFERSSTVKFAGFGARSSFNTLTPDKLHFVYTRLGAQYRINRHLIGIHGGFQYLYGAQGQIVTQVQDQLVTGITQSTDYDWLVTDGLRRWNWTADLSYGYQIAPRWSVIAGADFYFSSITVEDPVLSAEGYYWRGAYAPIHPFITLNYLIYAGR